MEDALKESSSSSAASAAGAPLARNFGCGRQQLLRPPPELGRKVAGARRRLGVGEHHCALGVVARGGRPGAGEQRRGEQRQGERPFEALRQHAIGEPRREQLALPSPAAQGLAPGALRQGPSREGEDLRRGERRRSLFPGARLGGVDRLLQAPGHPGP